MQNDLDTAESWASAGEIFALVNPLRVELRLTVYGSPAAISTHLKRRAVPFIRQGKRKKLYRVEDALLALTQMKHGAQPLNRPGTAEETKDSNYQPITEAALMLRCHMSRLTRGVHD